MIRYTIAFTISFILAACNKPNVVVVDSTGAPIAGASVEPVSLSINYSPVRTDKKGQVYVKEGVQPVQWIHVSKAGYTRSENIDFTQSKPIRVVLTK